MAKAKTLFACQQCGAQRARWEGRCTDCGAWNSFVEETTQVTSRGWQTVKSGKSTVTLDQDIVAENQARGSTGIGELDRVLGGGLIHGSYVLVGGDPGIGKSTLLLQMAGGLARGGHSVLYVSAEESVQQTALRAQRLGVREAKVQVASESSLDAILQLAEAHAPKVLIVDSIQTVYLSELNSAPGSVSQVRECAARLMNLAKVKGISVFLIGHVTKEGGLAGPKVLEHMVDTVLSFEGDAHYPFRLLRALKNRFGATQELGVFQMASEGLKEVPNPSEFFLSERGSDVMGSAIFPAIEGSRPLLCEIQALTSSTPMSMPRRTALGFDVNRVHMLLAVLDKHLDMEFARNDIFINVVGGLKLTEPAADLAVAAALISSQTRQELSRSMCFFGEIGLTGEVRAVSFFEDRLREGQKLGFQRFIVPASNRKHLTKSFPKDSALELTWVENVLGLLKSLKQPLF